MYVKKGANFKSEMRFMVGVMSALLIFLGLATFSRMNDTQPGAIGDCKEGDADLVGLGIRIAAWLQLATSFLGACYGSFHRDDTAVKEVGAGMFVNHQALAIALLVATVHGTLKPVDAILGTMYLDALNISLSIQLSAKETLASRWQTYLVILGQLAGLATIASLVQNFQQNRLSTQSCDCLSIFWWAWLSNCPEKLPNSTPVFWVYYALRVLFFLHSAYISVLYTSSFDLAKKKEEESPCRQCKLCSTQGVPRERAEGTEYGKVHGQCWCAPCDCGSVCRFCNFPYPGGPSDCAACSTKLRGLEESRGWVGGLKYSQLTATIDLEYIANSLIALFSMVSAESMMSTYHINPSAEVNTFGQVSALVVAVGTFLRCLWVSAQMWWKPPRRSVWSGDR